MTNLAMWSLVVGFFMPPVQAIIQQTGWPSSLRATVNFAACALAAVGIVYWQGDFTGRRFVESGLLVLVTTIATYKGTWEPSNIAPKIERATNFGANP